MFLALPEIERSPIAPVITPNLSKAMRIYAPRFYEPTQTAPNTGKVSRELDVRSAEPAPRPQAPHFRAPQPAPGPVAEAASPRRFRKLRKSSSPGFSRPENRGRRAPASASRDFGQSSGDTPPPPTAPAKPKLAFESIGAGQTHTAPNPTL